MAQNQEKADCGGGNSCLNRAIFVVKEHFVRTLSHPKKIYNLYFDSYEHKLTMAA
jgi:hypothetical protein